MDANLSSIKGLSLGLMHFVCVSPKGKKKRLVHIDKKARVQGSTMKCFIVSVSFTNVLPICVQRYEKIILAFNRKQCTVFVHNNLAIDIYLNKKKKILQVLIFSRHL